MNIYFVMRGSNVTGIRLLFTITIRQHVGYDGFGDNTRHLQMLLIVSSFGESRRWVYPTAASFKFKFEKFMPAWEIY